MISLAPSPGALKDPELTQEPDPHPMQLDLMMMGASAQCEQLQDMIDGKGPSRNFDREQSNITQTSASTENYNGAGAAGSPCAPPPVPGQSQLGSWADIRSFQAELARMMEKVTAD